MKITECSLSLCVCEWDANYAVFGDQFSYYKLLLEMLVSALRLTAIRSTVIINSTDVIEFWCWKCDAKFNCIDLVLPSLGNGDGSNTKSQPPHFHNSMHRDWFFRSSNHFMVWSECSNWDPCWSRTFIVFHKSCSSWAELNWSLSISRYFEMWYFSITN